MQCQRIATVNNYSRINLLVIYVKCLFYTKNFGIFVVTKTENMHKSFSGLNPQFIDPTRMLIMQALIDNPSQDFPQLKTLTETTDGCLAHHMHALENNNFITIEKSFKKKRQCTTATITAEGKDLFIDHMKQMVDIADRALAAA